MKISSPGLEFRFPWILSRRRLLLSIFFDLSISFILYNTVFIYLLGGFNFVDNFLICFSLFWVLISYLLGRYSLRTNPSQTLSIIRQIVLSVATTFFAFGVTFMILKILPIIFFTNSQRTVFPFYLFLIAILSPTLQLFLQSLVPSSISNSQRWLVLGSLLDLKILNEWLLWSRIPVQLELIDLNSLQHADSPIVVSQGFLQSKDISNKILSLLTKGVPVSNFFNWCEIILQRLPPNALSLTDVITGKFFIANDSIEFRIKRLADILVATILLFITSPVILLSAILVKQYDNGPIWYSQIRSGLNGNPYRIWKIRTMSNNSEINGPQWFTINDKRVTPIGVFLRKTRIDELPQLICVIKGQMSLIGPRPERPEIEVELIHKIPFYELRHSVRPGLSGWAQVNYHYGSSIFDSSNKLSYDLFYIKNFSFWLDLLILFKTIRLVFRAEGSNPQVQLK